MGSSSYNKFIDVSVVHDFYESNVSADFSIVPASGTAVRLRDQKMLFRALKTGFTVRYRTNGIDATPFQTVEDGKYAFVMQLRNALEFVNVTNLRDTANNVSYASGRILYFRNTNTSTNALSYELLNRLLPAVFNYDFTITNTQKVHLRVVDENAAVAYESGDLLPDDNGAFHAKVDLSAAKPGKYVIQQVNNITLLNPDGDVVATEKVYVDNNLFGADVFGIIAIELKTSGGFTFADFVGLGTFNATFVRRTSKWQYFIVNKTHTEDDEFGPPVTLTVVDASPTDPVYGTLGTFTLGTSPDINGNKAVSLLSQFAVPFYELPKQKVELRRGNSSVIIAHLANPTRQAVSADPADFSITNIYVFI